jgi:SAM-dependent methyltransferase
MSYNRIEAVPETRLSFRNCCQEVNCSRWTTLRRYVVAWLRDRRQFTNPRLPRTCPICGHHGVFISVGHPPRWDARCPGCGSRERHRLMHLWVTAGGADRLDGKRILHFAPEKFMVRRMTGNPLYETADLHAANVTHSVDATRIPLPDGRYDVVIANHVLEHIDSDQLAMREFYRILASGGVAVLSVPINPTRQQTYENPGVTTAAGRWAHFSDKDHRRYYGLDFAERLSRTGFEVQTFRMSPEEEVQYGLLRDECIYIASKPAAVQTHE